MILTATEQAFDNAIRRGIIDLVRIELQRDPKQQADVLLESVERVLTRWYADGMAEITVHYCVDYRSRGR